MTRLSAWLDTLTPAQCRWLAIGLLVAVWVVFIAAVMWWA